MTAPIGHPAGLALWALCTAALGVAALAAGLEGWLIGPCGPLTRLMLLAAGILAIDPGLNTDLIALALFGAAMILSFRRKNDLPASSTS